MLYELVVIWVILSIIVTIILGIKYYREEKYSKTSSIRCPKCGYKGTIRTFKKG